MTLRLQIINTQGDVLASSPEGREVFLVHEPAYTEGDQIVVRCEDPNAHLVMSLDDTLAPALVYLTGNHFALPVPFGKNALTYSPRAFSGQRHRLWARLARPDEIAAYRNLTLNPFDHHANQTLFPHGWANVETRGEAVFAARNAIDGEKANTDHGFWPYTSWGINQNPQAELSIAFGRSVEIDALSFYLRADFPHDAWWTRASVSFSDGSAMDFALEKTGGAQRFEIAPRKIEWLRLHSLIKADDPSPFPALTQLEVWGRN